MMVMRSPIQRARETPGLRSISVVTTLATNPTPMTIIGTRNSDAGSAGPRSRRSPDDSRRTGFFFLTTFGGSCGASARGAEGREVDLLAGFLGRAVSDME